MKRLCIQLLDQFLEILESKPGENELIQILKEKKQKLQFIPGSNKIRLHSEFHDMNILLEELLSERSQEKPKGKLCSKLQSLHLDRLDLKEAIKSKVFDEDSLSGSAVPLIIPGNFKWDSQSNFLIKESDERMDLVVVPSVLEIIQQYDCPVGCISIAGPARSGKSYMLNRLLGIPFGSDGFKLGGQFDACTMGIWMWSKPLMLKLDDDTDFAVFLFDTEGLNAFDADENDDSKIFVLSVLLSTLFIYNSPSVPRSSDIESLELVVHMAEKIDRLSERENFSKMPKFFWLLRDVVLCKKLMVNESLVDVSFLEYMRAKVFYIVENPSSEKEEKMNKIRRAVLEFFDEFDGNDLPFPSFHPEAIQDIENPEFSDKISPSFKSKAEDIKREWIRKVTPKIGMNGEPLNGNQYANIIELYVEGVNSPDGMPNLDSVWEQSIKMRYNETLENAFIKYRSHMDSIVLPLEHNEILDAHQRIMIDITEDFNTSTKMDSEYHEEYFQKLNESISIIDGEGNFTGGFLNTYITENDNASNLQCQKLIDDLEERHIQPLLTAINTLKMEDVGNAVECVICEYTNNAIGPQKNKIMQIWYQNLEQRKKELESHLKMIEGFKLEIFMNEVKQEEEYALQLELVDRQKRLESNLKIQELEIKNQIASLKRRNEEAKKERQNQLKRDLEYAETQKQKYISDRKSEFDAKIQATQRLNGQSLKVLQQSHDTTVSALESSLSVLENRVQYVVHQPPPRRSRGCVVQ